MSSTAAAANGTAAAVAVSKPTLPERIIFAIDLNSEMRDIDSGTAQGEERWPKMTLVKDAIKIFVHSKLALSDRHQFALCVLKNSPSWLLTMTGNKDSFFKAVDSLVASETEFKELEVAPLISMAEQVVRDSPGYTVRVIVVYARTTVIPTLSCPPDRVTNTFPLFENPRFSLDALFLHRPSPQSPPANQNNAQSNTARAQDVYDVLTALDGSQHRGYFFAVSNRREAFFTNFASLLAHPQQRFSQGNQISKLVFSKT